MRSSLRATLACCGMLAALALAAVATADPGEDHSDAIPVPAPSLPEHPPGIEGMELLDVADKDGTINSDIAFFGNLAYVGNYDGFRIIDISNPSDMQVLSDTKCRANQGDVSVFEGSGRRYMLQSIDRTVDAPDCSAKDTPVVQETDEFGVAWARARFGYEGLRLFDVTNPRAPKYLAFFRTECGSHTHTLVPDGKRVHAYVASYPLLSQITPEQDRQAAGNLFCDAPHSKISIVTLPVANPAAGTVRTQPLAADTEYYDHDGPIVQHKHRGKVEYHGTAPAFQSCHDYQAFMPRRIVVAACAGDLQYWSIADPAQPTTNVPGRYTLIQREVREDDPSTPGDERWESFDFMHNSTVTWDGKVVAAVDEAGGGVAARCDGSQTKRGFTWFYPLVEPGTPVNGFAELGRYMVPRPQGSEVCVSHNGNVLPTSDGRYRQVQAFYQAGNSFFDFTDPSNATEISWSDLEDAVGGADSWSSYWYNDVLYVNGGLGERHGSNRGFEAYAVYNENGNRVTTRNWRMLNPQTQEVWQLP
jgi:LVIVD repeat